MCFESSRVVIRNCCGIGSHRRSPLGFFTAEPPTLLGNPGSLQGAPLRRYTGTLLLLLDRWAVFNRALDGKERLHGLPRALFHGTRCFIDLQRHDCAEQRTRDDCALVETKRLPD